MTVRSTFFGVTKLTKEDSDKFRRQVAFGRPPKAAKKSLRDGKKLLRDYESNGFVQLKVKKVA